MRICDKSEKQDNICRIILKSYRILLKTWFHTKFRIITTPIPVVKNRSLIFNCKTVLYLPATSRSKKSRKNCQLGPAS